MNFQQVATLCRRKKYLHATLLRARLIKAWIVTTRQRGTITSDDQSARASLLVQPSLLMIREDKKRFSFLLVYFSRRRMFRHGH